MKQFAVRPQSFSFNRTSKLQFITRQRQRSPNKQNFQLSPECLSPSCSLPFSSPHEGGNSNDNWTKACLSTLFISKQLNATRTRLILIELPFSSNLCLFCFAFHFSPTRMCQEMRKFLCPTTTEMAQKTNARDLWTWSRAGDTDFLIEFSPARTRSSVWTANGEISIKSVYSLYYSTYIAHGAWPERRQPARRKQ